MANLQPSLSIPPSFAGASPPSPSPIGGGSGGAAVGQAAKDRKMASAEQLVLDLCDPELRENALLELSKKREIFQDLAPLLWHSFGTVAALLQEIVSIYPALSPPTLSPGASNRVCNALALLQCVASHPETMILFLNAHIPLYLYPFLNTTSKTRPFEYLRLTSLGVIGALVKVDDTEVISFLLQTEIFLCACVPWRWVVSCPKPVLANMVVSLADQPSTRLLKHIIRCYLRLSDNPRACAALQSCLPDMLKDGTFNSCLRDDPATRRWLQQLLHNVTGGGIGGAAQPGLDHMMGM